MFAAKLERIVFYFLLLFLPTQLGKHFWPDFAIIAGIRVDYLSPTVYFTDVLIGVLFLSWLIRKVHYVKFTTQSYNKITFNTFRGKLQRMMLLGIFLFANIYLSQNIFNGLYHLLKLFEFSFVAYYVATTVMSLRQLKRIFFVLGIGVIGQSLLTLAQFIKQGSLSGVFYWLGERFFTGSTPGIANVSLNGELILRPYATFSHPNVLAGFLLISMIGLFFTYFWTKRAERVIWTGALLLGSSALLLTMSRVAFILWISLLLAVFVRSISQRYLKIFSLVMLSVIAAVFLTVTPFGSRLLQTSFTEEAFVQRLDLINASVTLFVSHPLIGVGIGNFLPKLATIATPLSLHSYLQPVHNLFLLVLAETGLIGLGMFLWFLLRTYKRLFAFIKKTRMLPYRLFVVLLSIILILGSFDHYFLTLQQGQLLFALVIGLSWASINR